MNLSGLNKKIIWLLSIASIGFLFLLIIGNLNLFIESIQTYIKSSKLLTAIGFLLLYAIKSVTMLIPNSVLYIAVGAIFPTWIAFLITYAGLTISLSIGYFTGLELGETKVYNLLARQKRTKAFLNAKQDNLLPLCFMMRLMAFPFGLASFFFGSLKTPFYKYVVVSLLGVTPTMLPMVFSGAAITEPLSAAFLFPFGISLTVILLIFIVYKKMHSEVT